MITIEKAYNGWIVRSEDSVHVFEVEESFLDPDRLEKLKFFDASM